MQRNPEPRAAKFDLRTTVKFFVAEFDRAIMPVMGVPLVALSWRHKLSFVYYLDNQPYITVDWHEI